MAPKRRPTSTSAFGVSRRESHDATAFYERFPLPETSTGDDINVNRPEVLDRIYIGDSRRMTELADDSVALVVTSPPYFAGKEYEQALGEGHVPSSYIEYLEMLHDVFVECRRVLEPGGRIAVNVANLGRRPYRSLAADVIRILQDDLRLLLRGEIIWVKGQGASGSCAWGSFQSPHNPVLRDLTERVVVASNGRFDRALSRRKRADSKLPSKASIFKDEFMEATTDVWDIPPESAQRVGHPAPFPVELPQRLIELYTYLGDVVVDPFAGSGSTAVAAVRSNRRFVCYDIDPGYVEDANRRVEEERRRLRARPNDHRSLTVELPVKDDDNSEEDNYQARAVREGKRAKEIAYEVLKGSGFSDIREGHRFRNGVEVNFVAVDKRGKRWLFDVSGAFTRTARPGLRRTDTLWKALGKAAVLSASNDEACPLILLTTDLPPRNSAGYLALKEARGGVYHDAIDMLSREGQERLSAYASGDHRSEPIGELLLPPQDD